MNDRAVVSPPVIRYVAAGDGTRLAWSASGHGTPALLHLSGWVSHLTIDWCDRELGAFNRALAARHRLIRYDRPGVGLSERAAVDFSLERQLAYLRSVVDACGEARLALFGRSFSGPLAIAFAAAHPERVSHLILFGTAARFVASPDYPEGLDPALAAAVEQLVHAEWGLASRTICEIMLPGIAPAAAAWYTEYQRTAASAAVAAAIIRATAYVDVTPLLARLCMPTLVLHRRDDRAVSVAAARRLAAAIPGARLAIFEGTANLPFYGDQREVLAAIEGFLDPPAARLTARERAVLGQVAEGRSNREIAADLSVTEHTVARHLANIFLKLDVGSRGAAVARARRAGLLPPDPPGLGTRAAPARRGGSRPT